MLRRLLASMQRYEALQGEYLKFLDKHSKLQDEYLALQVKYRKLLEQYNKPIHNLKSKNAPSRRRDP